MVIREDMTPSADTSPLAPRWIVPSMAFKEGRDPLGLQTTTQDRLMPELLPGILELSRRARYFSFHAFLLDEYRKRRLPVDRASLSTFMKRREWDLGLAIERCPHHCGSTPVGARRLGSRSQGPGPFPRGESVDSPFGGYGLYYRSPLSAFGIVAKSGTLLGDEPIPIDVLYPTERAARLAQTFRSAVDTTAYYARWMLTEELLPADVVDEYASVACLCQLGQHPAERDAIHDAMFGTDDVQTVARPEEPDAADAAVGMVYTDETVAQRKRSVAHYLTLIAEHPEIVQSESVYRDALWSPPPPRTERDQIVGGEWAALIAKDVWQEVLCSVWSEFCRTGLARNRDLGRGLTAAEVKDLAASMVNGPPDLAAVVYTREIVDEASAGRLSIRLDADKSVNLSTETLEGLRRLTRTLDTATSGVVVLAELFRRTLDRSDSGWLMASHTESAWQPSVAAVLMGFGTHLDSSPTIADTLCWLVSRFVITVHERIGYSKLHAREPEFTFRFRWEDGLLRFFDHGIGRFPLAAIRNEPLASLTRDLGMWEMANNNQDATLTSRAQSFIDEALA
jgi:hypothetical protein